MAGSDPLPGFLTPLNAAAMSGPKKRSRKVAFQEEVDVASEKKKRQDNSEQEAGDDSERSECALIRVPSGELFPSTFKAVQLNTQNDTMSAKKS